MQAKKTNKTPWNSLESLKYALAAFSSSFCVQILHPFDLIKTRFQSHDGGSGSGNQVPEYRGIRHAFSKIYSEEGFKGLYKGFAWTLFA